MSFNRTTTAVGTGQVHGSSSNPHPHPRVPSVVTAGASVEDRIMLATLQKALVTV